MVGKIKTGANFKGVLRYNEKEQAEIIDKNMAGNNAQELTKEFMLGHELNKRVERPVKHHIISFGRTDKDKLNPDRLQEITQDYLNRFGYSNNQYVSYLHQDTANPHLHIIVNKVDMDGHNSHFKLEKNRARKILMEFEKKYGLEETREHNPDKDAFYDKTYIEIQKRILRQESKKTDKEYIHTAIAAAIEQKPISPDDFAKKIKNYGVELIRQGGGYKFSYKGREYKASTIHREFSYKKLNNIFEKNNEKRKQEAEKIHGAPQKKVKKKRQQKKPKQQPQKKSIVEVKQPHERTGQDQHALDRLNKAIQDYDVAQVARMINKRDSGQLNKDEISLIIRHKDLNYYNKKAFLLAGGIEKPEKYFSEMKESSSQKDKGQNKDQGRNKGPDMSM